MSFWQGSGLMALGGAIVGAFNMLAGVMAIVGAFNMLAWVMYRIRRREERRYFK